MFTGSLVALITPFKNGSVDEKGFEKFVAWQIKEGTDGLVPCGTTGVLLMLSHRGARTRGGTVRRNRQWPPVPVIAGTGSNATDEAISLSTRHAKRLGADAALSGSRRTTTSRRRRASSLTSRPSPRRSTSR